MSDAVPSMESAPTKRRGLGIGRSILLCIVFNLIFVSASGLVVSLLGFWWRATGKSGEPSFDSFAVFLVPQVIAWIVVILLGLVWLNDTFRSSSRLKPFPAHILPALLVTSFGATILLLEVASRIPMPEVLREAIARRMEGGSRLIMLLPVVIVAPLAEEIFFRGLVLRGYLERYSISTAIWASAILFAVFHLNPWQGVVALPLGVWYAWMVVRTGSVVPGIVSHATVNFSTNFLIGPLAMLLGYAADDIEQWRHYPPLLLIVGAAMVVVGGGVLGRQLVRISPPPVDPARPQTGEPGIDPGTIDDAAMPIAQGGTNDDLAAGI